MVTILVVDEHGGTGGSLRHALRGDDHVVLEVPDVASALCQLEAHHVDVTVLGMPRGREGVDVCRQLCRHSAAPVVAVTATDDSRDVVAFLDAGADDCVTAPVESRILAARIRSVIRRRVEPSPS